MHLLGMFYVIYEEINLIDTTYVPYQLYIYLLCINTKIVVRTFIIFMGLLKIK